ncbi:RNA 3'-terminal phosphate cyclase [Paludisphaera borealis]|uniref:RNA 3'-terminal phosphate cyclase n=1 Tax=Paludisphaera borealis TaxID=1387353 RepID=A0A1U7CR64_9BACT|nr:RNA 3'-terminal phosphate cyclase [Paludisphaera borealis]
MEGDHTSGERRDERWQGIEPAPSRACRKRWTSHAAHERISTPVRPAPTSTRPRISTESHAVSSSKPSAEKLIVLDGSRGEGGGQILRSALTLSLLTGRPFRITKIRANRDKPGLRPQHLKAVEAAALLGGADVAGAEVGSRDLVFRPGQVDPRDLTIDIGTAGSTSLILQTLHLPIALKADTAVRIILTGGTFNPKAPPYPFLDQTWRGHLANLGMPIALAMPAAGFYPRGGGRLEAWIEPARPRPWVRTTRGDLLRIRGVAGTANLRDDVARRLRDRALERIRDQGWNVDVEIETASWTSPGQGAAISLTAEHAGSTAATFVGIGERGKPAELVADEAVAELFAFLNVPDGAVDPHSADQILLPLALAEGRSVYTVSEVTEHLRTNAATIRSFLDRSIVVEEAAVPGQPGRVIVE